MEIFYEFHRVLSNLMDVIGSWFGNFRPKTHLKSIWSNFNFHVGFGLGVLKPNETLLITMLSLYHDMVSEAPGDNTGYNETVTHIYPQ